MSEDFSSGLNPRGDFLLVESLVIRVIVIQTGDAIVDKVHIGILGQHVSVVCLEQESRLRRRHLVLEFIQNPDLFFRHFGHIVPILLSVGGTGGT